MVHIITSIIVAKVILIVIIIKIDVLTIILGSNNSSQNKTNFENQCYQNSQKHAYQTQINNAYAQNRQNDQSQKTKHPQYQNNVQQPKQNFQNIKANKPINQHLNCNNSCNSIEADSLLLQDVYGEKFSSNNFDSKENCSNFSTCCSSNCNNANDFSSIFKNLFQSSGDSDNNTADSTMPDFETILKFKKIFERINSKSSTKDPVVNLLYAVKPFMQESKKSIIDQLAKFMTISTALQDFSSFL